MQAEQIERASQARVAAIDAASPIGLPAGSSVQSNHSDGKRHFPVRTVGLAAGLVTAGIIGTKTIPAIFDHDQPPISADDQQPVQDQSFQRGYNIALAAQSAPGDLYKAQHSPQRIAELRAPEQTLSQEALVRLLFIRRQILMDRQLTLMLKQLMSRKKEPLC